MTNVLVIGWFGHGNAGDDRLGEILPKILPGVNFCFSPLGMFSPPMVNQFDAVIVIAGVIHERSPIIKSIDKWISDVNVPIYLLGISSEYLPNTPIQKIQKLIEKAAYVYVRDHETKLILGNSDKIIVGPDLTFFDPLNLSIYDTTNFKDFRWILNLRDTKFKGIDWNKMLDALGSIKTKPAAWSFEPGEKLIYNKLTIDETIDFQKNRTLSDVHFAITMRLHAAIFSIQMGIPFLAISYHQKVDMLMRDMGLQDSCFQPDAIEQIVEYINSLNPGSLNNKRQVLIDLRSSLHKQSKVQLEDFKASFFKNTPTSKSNLRGRLFQLFARKMLVLSKK